MCLVTYHCRCYSASSDALYKLTPGLTTSLGTRQTTIEGGQCVYALEFPDNDQFDKATGDAAQYFYFTDGQPLDASEVRHVAESTSRAAMRWLRSTMGGQLKDTYY